MSKFCLGPPRVTKTTLGWFFSFLAMSFKTTNKSTQPFYAITLDKIAS